MSNSGAAPTGCYKCGRPGHWSRDCPSSGTNPNPNPNADPNSALHSSKPSSFKAGAGGDGALGPAEKSSEKPKRLPRTRPKLTPELLLSDDGLGYVLRHFPRAFKYRGRGHEVNDLGNLIALYSEWHSHLLPYYSFDQFVRKVEQVGTTRHVRMCIRELRERVANGGDPTKLRETPVECDDPNHEQEAVNSQEPSHFQEDPSLKNHNADDAQEEMLHEIYEMATEEPSQNLHEDMVVAETLSDGTSLKELPNQELENGASRPRAIQVTEEQKARIESNRLKALERAAARARSLQTA